jgi:hypothetical protein
MFIVMAAPASEPPRPCRESGADATPCSEPPCAHETRRNTANMARPLQQGGEGRASGKSLRQDDCGQNACSKKEGRPKAAYR